MAKTVFDVLEEKLVDQQRSIEEFLHSGGPKDFAEYREACGAIRGLSTARRELHDLVRHQREQNDD